MMSTNTTTSKARLSCNHTVDVTDDAEIGTKTPCPKCPRKGDTGAFPQRTIKAVVTTRPTGDDVVDTALAQVGQEIAAAVADEIEANPDGVTASVAKGTSPKAAARIDRLARAKEAAANGDDAAAVLAEPLPTETPKRRRGRAPSRVTFLNLSPVRVAALRAAGFPGDRLDGPTVDLQADDVARLLADLPAVCAGEGTEAKAACRLAAWLERFRAAE